MLWPIDLKKTTPQKLSTLEAWNINSRLSFMRQHINNPPKGHVVFFVFTPEEAFGIGADYTSFLHWQIAHRMLMEDSRVNPFDHNFARIGNSEHSDIYRIIVGRELNDLSEDGFLALKRASIFTERKTWLPSSRPSYRLLTLRSNELLKNSDL